MVSEMGKGWLRRFVSFFFFVLSLFLSLALSLSFSLSRFARSSFVFFY